MAVRAITLLFLVFLSLAALANSLTGKVVKITDGDTLYVLDANYRATQNPFSRDRCARTKAGVWTGFAQTLSFDSYWKQVTIEYQKRDRYGRIVGKVLLNGIDACLESPT